MRYKQKIQTSNNISYKKVKVEIGIEVGLMLNVKAKFIKDEINIEDTITQIKNKVSDIFNIDGKDKILNNVYIYAIQ